MDVRITWAIPPDIQITDEFDVLYKVADPANLNNWIIANPSPLSSTTSFFDIAGLDPNTVYRFAVTKSCFGTVSTLDEGTWYARSCPVIGIYQGPPIFNSRSTPTLFYSLYYPDSNHVAGASVNLFDFNVGNTGTSCVPPLNVSAAIVGRSSYQTVNLCSGVVAFDQYRNCNTQGLDTYPLYSANTSAVGYFGLDGNSLCCNANGSYSPAICGVFGGPNDPILLTEAVQYQFIIDTKVQDPYNDPPPPINNAPIIISNIGFCADPTAGKTPGFIPVGILNKIPLISGSLCWDSTTGLVTVSVKDGTNQTYAPGYTYLYFTEDSSGNQLPLTNGSGTAVSTGDVSYTVYCPVKFTPDPLTPSQLSDNMSYQFFMDTGAPALIYTGTGLNLSGLTLAQAYTTIAQNITTNTTFTAAYEAISGNDYIKINVPGTSYLSAEIVLSGDNILYSQVDIPQVPLVNINRYGIMSAVTYSTGGEDFVYGTRGFQQAVGCLIEATNITTQTTVEYSHPIDYPCTKLVLVDKPVAPKAYDVAQFGPDDAYWTINCGVIATGGAYDGYTYSAVRSGANVNIVCYDGNGVLYDTSAALGITQNVLNIEVNQTNGNLNVFCQDPLGINNQYYLISHNLGTNTYAVVTSSTYTSSNEVYSGTVTGKATYVVQSVNVAGNSITFTTNIDVPGGTTWNNYVITVKSATVGAQVGNQAILYDYQPLIIPPQNQIPNNTTTVFINPSPGFIGTANQLKIDLTQINPGDEIVFLNTRNNAITLIDTNIPWPDNTYRFYDVMIESGVAAGSIAKIQSSVNDEIRINQSFSGNFMWKGLGQNFLHTGYGTKYRISKINDGGTLYNPFNNSVYYSCGNAQILIISSTGVISIVTVKNSTGIAVDDGAFQMTVDPTNGNVYAIIRDSSLSVPGAPETFIDSQDIYVINGAGVVQNAIAGASRWAEEICGNISFVQSGGQKYLYFTQQSGSTIYQYNITADTWTSKFITTGVYKKSQKKDKINGAVHIGNNRFVGVVKLQGNDNGTFNYNPRIFGYDYSNLVVYDFGTGEVVQVLVGANNAPYPTAASGGFWNPNGYGEMFGEWNPLKDYGAGGTSIKFLNSRIYRKEFAAGRHYISNEYDETGVAQLWGHGRVTNPGSGARLIRIWNIQSNGSLVPSARTIYNHGVTGTIPDSIGSPGGVSKYRNYTISFDGIFNGYYDTFYEMFVAITYQNNSIILIDPTDLTGYYGGPSTSSYDGTWPSAFGYQLTNKLAIDTGYNTPNTLRFGWRVIGDNAGRLFVFSTVNNLTTKRYAYNMYESSVVTGSTYQPSLTAETSVALGNDPGLYWTGYNGLYTHQYIASTNELWIVGHRTITCTNISCTAYSLGDQIIRVYDPATMTVVTEINLTAQNAEVLLATDNFDYNFDFIAAFNRVGYYSPATDKLVLIDPVTKTITYNGLMSTHYNFKRTPPLTVPSVLEGWFVPYGNGFLLDYTINGLLPEKWTYIVPTTVDYTGDVHNLLTIRVNGVDILVDDNVYSPTLTGNTFGQWKTVEALPMPGDDVVYWNYMPGGGTITVNPNETIEFTQFSKTDQIAKVVNLTTSVTYDITDPAYINAAVLPTFNTLNSIPFFAIKADYVNLNPGDQLEFTFSNPIYPTCPFINTITVNF